MAKETYSVREGNAAVLRNELREAESALRLSRIRAGRAPSNQAEAEKRNVLRWQHRVNSLNARLHKLQQA